MELLFNKGNLSDYLQAQKNELQSEVDAYQPDYLLKISEGDLVEYLVTKYTLHAPQILEDEIYQHEPQDVDIDVSQDHSRAIFDRDRPFYIQGTAIRISIPFEGDPALFNYQPSTFTFNPPRGQIVSQEIQLLYELRTADAEDLSRAYQQTLSTLRQYLGWIQRDVDEYNRQLQQFAQQSITRRRDKVLADRKMSAALGIPLKRRDDAPRTYAVPTVRKKPAIVKPTVDTEEPFESEPELATAEYEEILRIVQSMVHVIERSPNAFVHMGEEALRQHFLVQLNGQYQGQATGETFNFDGKTDILIRVDGKNIFIAECKFWTGPKGLTETIDQLLSYTSWRDTKTAILLFNKDRNLSTVLEKVPGIAEQHPCFKKNLGVENETVFRYLFHQPNDPNRELLLTVLVFDTPRP